MSDADSESSYCDFHDALPQMASEKARFKSKGGGGGGDGRGRRVTFSPAASSSHPRSAPKESDGNAAGATSPASGSQAARAGSATTPPPQQQPASTAPGVPPLNTHIHPAAGLNPTFTHYLTPGAGQPPFFQPAFPTHPVAPTAPPPWLPPPQNLYSYGAPRAPAAAMPEYQNAVPINMGTNYQPQVPDTSYGPMVHTYVPRNDVLGGFVYVAAPGPPNVSPQVYFTQPVTPQAFVYQVPVFYTPVYYPAQAFAVPVQGAPIANVSAPVVPIMAHQPGLQPQPQPQPLMMAPGQPVPFAQGGPMMMGAPAGPGNYGIHPEPAMGTGRSPGEVMAEQVQFAHVNNLNEPQDFKPADDDISRMYMMRELDGNWTLRSRITIDRIPSRWYITDNGVFYAVRLPN